MTIKSRQLSRIVSHYIANAPNKKDLEYLIESFNTDTAVAGVFIEDLGKLGKAYNVNGFGAYVVSDSEMVIFMTNI